MPSVLSSLGFPFSGPSFPVAVADDDVLEQSLASLAETGPDERVMRPGAGAGLQRFIFENADEVVAELIRAELQAVYARWEPRAEILGIDVVPFDEGESPSVPGPGWLVTVHYQSRVTGREGSVPVTLSGGAR